MTRNFPKIMHDKITQLDGNESCSSFSDIDSSFSHTDSSFDTSSSLSDSSSDLSESSSSVNSSFCPNDDHSIPVIVNIFQTSLHSYPPPA